MRGPRTWTLPNRKGQDNGHQTSLSQPYRLPVTLNVVFRSEQKERDSINSKRNAKVSTLQSRPSCEAMTTETAPGHDTTYMDNRHSGHGHSTSIPSGGGPGGTSCATGGDTKYTYPYGYRTLLTPAPFAHVDRGESRAPRRWMARSKHRLQRLSNRPFRAAEDEYEQVLSVFHHGGLQVPTGPSPSLRTERGSRHRLVSARWRLCVRYGPLMAADARLKRYYVRRASRSARNSTLQGKGTIPALFSDGPCSLANRHVPALLTGTIPTGHAPRPPPLCHSGRGLGLTVTHANGKTLLALLADLVSQALWSLE
ncbi:hypothetical protein LZ30DRAFT_361459 [Colletotrichum cereale]|nr:hypothetical protein LZ30DRAFT_361459 [Colletotrichum cereale]